MVQLNDDLVERLDVEAKRAGQSRSAFIRQVLSERLAELDTNAKIEQWVEGYRRIPPGTVDEWGDLEAEANDPGSASALASSSQGAASAEVSHRATSTSTAPP